MTDVQESENAKDDPDLVRKQRPQSKKKVEAEIREKEAELKSLGGRGGDTLKNLRAEKEATYDRMKKTDTNLKALNKTISEKMTALSKLQSSLHYTSEEKHNDAIRKLEWNLNVQNFKLSQEKKIVAEIDSLKKSKRQLGQYLAMKKEMDECRDRQRRMREEKDHYYKTLTQLKAKEDDIKKRNYENRSRAEALKKEINDLYEKKRAVVSEIKHKERQRAESFRKREEERRAQVAAHHREIEEIEALKEPYEDERNLCSMLIVYLSKLCPDSLPESYASIATTPTTDEQPPYQGSLAPESEDGYRLLRKSDECEEFPALTRKPNKNRRRSRKMSTTKPVTHSPHVLSQFSSLNLNAPASHSEIAASIEQLHGRKLYFEQEAEKRKLFKTGSEALATWGFMGEKQPIIEELSQSEADISATESVVCEMSRQASKTESCESANDTRPSDSVIEELLLCDANCADTSKTDLPEIGNLSLSDSESTLEGSNGESMGSGNDFERELHSQSGQTDI